MKYDIDHLYSEPHVFETSKKKNKKSKRKEQRDTEEYFKNNQSRKLKKRGFNFLSFQGRKKSRKNNKMSSSLLDLNEDSNRSDSELLSNIQNVCGKPFRAAKDASRHIYNKLTQNYDYSYSYATVVYSDRYFLYNLTLETRLMPLRCFMCDDINKNILYKRNKRTCKIHTTIMNCDNNWLGEINLYTYHYMPVFTAWSIQPFTSNAGLLCDVSDRSVNLFGDRKHSTMYFEEMQKFYEANRVIYPYYKPIIDVFTCSRELLDYDDFLNSHVKYGEMTQKQIYPLFYHNKRPLGYRISMEGLHSHPMFTQYEISKAKGSKKNYSFNTNIHFVSKFPIPDFALSEDDLVMRWRNNIYDFSKIYNTSKIYEKIYKQTKNISNLTLNELDAKHNKLVDNKKINFEQQPQDLFDRQNYGDPTKNNIVNTKLLDYKNYEKSADFKFGDNIADILLSSSNERGKLVLMEPLLLMQNLNEERLKNKTLAAKKAQRFMVYFIISYTVLFIGFSLLAFYIMYFA